MGLARRRRRRSQPEDYDSADDFDEELFKNAQDRAEVLAMADVDRELILCDRYDRKQRRNETLQLRRELCARLEGPTCVDSIGGLL